LMETVNNAIGTRTTTQRATTNIDFFIHFLPIEISKVPYW
jgi:hypothetical protein